MSETKQAKVPEIRFKGFSGEWGVVGLLDNIAKIIDFRGRTPKKLGLDWSASGYRALSALNVKQGYIDFSIDPHFGNQELYDKWMSGSELHKDQVLFTTEAPMGNVAQIPNSDKYILSQRTIAFVVKPKVITENFLAVLLRSPKVFQELSALSSGGTAKGVSQRVLAKINITLPRELTEQTSIGNTFQKLDNLINQHQQKHDTLSNIKKAILEKMFPKQGETVPEIRFKGFSGEWEEKELGTDVAEIIGGGTPSTAISEFWDGDIDWYSPTEIGKRVYANGSEKKITALGLKSSSAKILPAGNTVLFTSRAGIGDMAILAKPGATNQGFQSLVVKEGFSPYFLYSSGKLIKEFALKHASGSTFLEVSGKQLGRMKILMPNYEEQTTIGNYFQKLDTLIDQHQQQLTKLNNIKQACLSKMFV
ncbi:restriction endonuclease subunit S [Marinomonas sp. 5E14-1]|uniref:restriction endonuclease subunit S n=1 Tax=Marinomonas sp. 5E14-1 TaxID=3153922 RepID=UPI003265F3DD